MFWHYFVTLSYKLQEVPSWESCHSSMFLQNSVQNGKKPEKLSKKNLRQGSFHSLATFYRWFLGENNGRKTTTLQPQAEQMFNIIGCTSEDSVINQSWSTQFCYIFPNGSAWFIDSLLCLCNMWKCRSYANDNAYVSSILSNGQLSLKYYFLRHRNFS